MDRRPSFRCRSFLSILGLLLILSCATAATVRAEGIEFSGTVLASDTAAGKLVVKKDDGGTRFTFVVSDKTQFAGGGPKKLAEVKKGDHVTVKYVVDGTRYVAHTITVSSTP